MSLRCEEPGWELVCMNDPTGRRGLWYRSSFKDGVQRVEICAGREGDDEYVTLTVGAEVTAEALDALASCLCRAERAQFDT